jgi:hypothetical protein
LLLITITHAFSNSLTEGAKLYCNEILDVLYDGEWKVVNQIINSNKRTLFIIGDEKIYEINEFGNMDWDIYRKTEYKTQAKFEYNNSEDDYSNVLTFFHETVSVRHTTRGKDFENVVDWNCSKTKNGMY